VNLFLRWCRQERGDLLAPIVVLDRAQDLPGRLRPAIALGAGQQVGRGLVGGVGLAAEEAAIAP